jgi:hypothetical protein
MEKSRIWDPVLARSQDALPTPEHGVHTSSKQGISVADPDPAPF